MARTKQQARRSTGPYPSKRSFGGNSKARSIPLTPFPLPADQDNEALAPFEAVSRNLAKIGSLTIGHFLQSPADAFDVPYHIQDNRLETSPTPPPALSATISKQPIPADGPSKMKCVAQLHHACQRAFGKTDLLKFEFIEVDGPNTKRCILTIMRPNGSRRSYTTPAVYPRKNEAKSQTAALAVEMGAIDFITTGDMDVSKKGLVLAPLDAHDSPADGEYDSVLPPDPEHPAVKEIEDCCVQWRASRVKPYWIALHEAKFGSRQGCALRIALSPYSQRVYSSDTKYDAAEEAKSVCAQVALDQGVLEYIKHGNGQIIPEKAIAASDRDADGQEAKDAAMYTPPSPSTLQSFYETFPQPFPENFGDKTAAEINAPSWLNTTIQSARGSKLSTNYIWTTNGTLWGGNFGLHGCLLRIERPEESRSYLVDARFPKRADAKAAVCLQAIFQGVGDYIRGIGQSMENKVTPTMKRWANDVIFPTLGLECNKIKPGTHPRYEFRKEKDAYGCTMTLELSTFPILQNTKTYTVPNDYRTKADAKIAVACLAAEEGAIEFLRFRGGPLPPGYRTFHSTLINGTTDVSNKRKDRDDDGPQERKKSKVESKEGDRPIPLLETKEEAMARINAERSLRQPHSRENRKGNNSGWKKPHAPGSSGLSTISRPAQGPSISQNRTKKGSASSSSVPHNGGGPQSQHIAPPRGPVMLGVPNTFPTAPQEFVGQGGPQVSPQQDQAPCPPAPAFPQVPPYPPPGFLHAPPPPTPVYYPPHGSNIPSGPPPYGQLVLPPQYHGSGPALPPSQAPPYPYPSAQYPQPPHYLPPHSFPPHLYQAQHPLHPPYSGVHPPMNPMAPAPNMVANYSPGYGNAQYADPLPGDPGQLSPNIQNNNQQHNSKNSPAGASAQTNNIDGMKSPTPKASPDAIQAPDGAPLRVTSISAPKSHVTSLIDYCSNEGATPPQFHQKAVTDGDGKVAHKVWVIMGNEKLELPTTFATVIEGRERVAKQVLGRLRSKGNTNNK